MLNLFLAQMVYSWGKKVPQWPGSVGWSEYSRGECCLTERMMIRIVFMRKFGEILRSDLSAFEILIILQEGKKNSTGLCV